MALGGGNFTSQNKVLPGAYMNFVSAASADAKLSDRGIATMPLELDWGTDSKIFEVTAEDFQVKSLELFGYESDSEKLKGLRDLFLNIKTLYAYKLTSGGSKAANDYAEALHSGIRGNDLKIVIRRNVENDTLYDVLTYLGNKKVDMQTAASSGELKENRFVKFKAAELKEEAAAFLTGGTNGTINGAAYADYFSKIEAYSYHAMGIVCREEEIKSLAVHFCKRLRDEAGVKFQTVLYRMPADYEGIVNVKNSVEEAGASEADLVYWVTGIIAGCGVNKSNLNKKYNGEFKVNAEYTQTELANAKKAGEFTLHKVGNEVRVLEDINSLVTLTEEKGEVFKENQTIRVIDQIANDIAVLFNTKYLGIMPNDNAGRVSLWSDIVKHHQALQDIRAIENFSDSDLTIQQGENKKSVMITDSITVVNAMSQLYMSVTVA